MKNRLTALLGVAGLAFASLASQAQINTLYSFDGTNSSTPETNVVAKGRLLVGTTTYGATYDYGVVWSMANDGTNFTILHDFGADATHGFWPNGTLVLKGKTVYGTTSSGGAYGYGVLYKINVNGTGYTVLHDFGSGTDAAYGANGITLSGNTLYGAGATGGAYGYGALFSINTDGSNYRILHDFGATSDGLYPNTHPVVKGTTIYGTTNQGGSYNGGTVYQVNTDGTAYTLLWSFHLSDTVNGYFPDGAVVLKGHILYGTTAGGGPYGGGQVYYINTNNNSGGAIHNFGSVGDGSECFSDLILVGNYLYGTTCYGGALGYGTLFVINTAGTTYAVLHSFDGTDGDNPTTFSGSGHFLYGTALNGGVNGHGTVFQYTR